MICCNKKEVSWLGRSLLSKFYRSLSCCQKKRQTNLVENIAFFVDGKIMITNNQYNKFITFFLLKKPDILCRFAKIAKFVKPKIPHQVNMSYYRFENN